MTVGEALSDDDLSIVAYELHLPIQEVACLNVESPFKHRGTEMWLDNKDVLAPYVKIRGKGIEGFKVNGKATRSFRVGDFPTYAPMFGISGAVFITTRKT